MQGNKINSTCNFQERDTHLKNTNLDLIALLDFISSYYADIVQFKQWLYAILAIEIGW